MKKRIPLLVFGAFAFSLLSCSPEIESSASSSNQPDSSHSSDSSKDNHSVDLPFGEAPTYDEDSIRLHYWRKDGTYKGWDLWLWEVGKDGASFAFNGKDGWGVIASYPLSTWSDAMNQGLGFVLRKGGDSWAEKDCGGADLFVDFSQFKKTDKGVYDIFMISGDSNIYSDANGATNAKIKYATFVNTSHIATLANLPIKGYELKENGVSIVKNENAGGAKRVDINFPQGKKVDYSANYELVLTFENGQSLSAPVMKTELFAGAEFGDLYNYDGDDLGVTYSLSHSAFAVWSPLSTSMKLRIYETGTPSSLGGDDTYQEYEMSKGEKGVFRADVSGNLEGKYYTYVVMNASFKNKEVVDPYAKGCGVNGLRGMIVDFSKTNPDGWNELSPLPLDRKSLVVYETHVADLTSSSTWNGSEMNRKKFAGMVEKGTTYSENGVTVKTGFDHIEELGVNAVQLIPIFDQANDETKMTFNWGYNPLNYNCLEGGYSSDPKDGYARIKEFKTLVNEYHKAGINIIMDVVYNHVSGAANSNFDVLMPGYYFRYTSLGELSNGSGCGNETASDHYMMRKFIVDSTSFWAKEYKLGGFRFDLMGLHDLETMNEVTKKAKEINPSIVIYGEPWSGGTSTLKDADSAKQINGNKYEGYGQFNDQMRDALIRGGLSGDTDLGWVTDTKSKLSAEYQNKLIKGVKGETYSGAVDIADPDKSVSYVTCHDNYTLFDRVMATKTLQEDDIDTAKKMNQLANSVVLTSQGTAFLLAGEEMLRSKGGNKNSYNASYETNELDYSLKIKHGDLFKNYQKLIALKESLGALHLNQDGIASLSPKMNSSGSLLSYDLMNDETNETYRIIHKNGLSGEESIDLSDYSLYWSTIEGSEKALNAGTKIQPFETIIAMKNS